MELWLKNKDYVVFIDVYIATFRIYENINIEINIEVETYVDFAKLYTN